MGAHFETLSGDGSAYMGNTLLCGTSIQTRCVSDTDHIGSGSEKVEEEEDERDMGPLYGLVALGYGVGFFTSFVWTMTVRGKQTCK